METLGLYLLKSAVWLTGFTLVFLVVLRNERYFRLNRIYLLTGIVAAIAFPFYTWHYAVIMPSVQVAFTTTSDYSAVATAPVSNPIPIYWWLYWIGMISIAIRLFWQTGMVVRKLRKTGYVRTGSVKLVRTAEYAASFSFFSFVFVNPSTSDIETKEIVNHEREHIQQRHWFDLLLVELLCMLQWFNPFVWIYARLIRQNHEYLADEMALQHTSNPAIYQATLLNQMLGAPVISLANSFSYSLNKKRFKMMKKKIDSPFRKLKVLLVLPLVAMVFYAFAKPEYITPTNAFPTDKINVSADGQKVKGKVVDSAGKPIKGVNVIIMGTTVGTITDNNGEFELKDVPKDGELVFSYVGLQTVVLKADSTKSMAVDMVPYSIGIDKVFVVGYVNPSGPPPPPPPAAPDLLNIDSKNPPLFLLDGIFIDKTKMDAISPYSIESLNVLKGEDAIKKYGEKGKNGVFEITLKNSHSVLTPAPQFETISDIKLSDIHPENTPLIYLDNVIIDKAKLASIHPDSIGSVEVLKGKAYIERDGDKAKNGIIVITSKKKEAENKQAMDKALYFADGVEITKDELAKIDPNKIESINVLKGEEAIKKYGDKGKNGVIIITSKTKQAASMETKADEVYTVVEEMPEYPGGMDALRDFFVKNIKYPVEAQKVNAQGTVIVNFVVSRNGKIERAKVVRGVHPLIDAEAIRIVGLLSSKADWKPGKQHGLAVDVSYTIPIEFKLQ